MGPLHFTRLASATGSADASRPLTDAEIGLVNIQWSKYDDKEPEMPPDLLKLLNMTTQKLANGKVYDVYVIDADGEPRKTRETPKEAVEQLRRLWRQQPEQPESVPGTRKPTSSAKKGTQDKQEGSKATATPQSETAGGAKKRKIGVDAGGGEAPQAGRKRSRNTAAGGNHTLQLSGANPGAAAASGSVAPAAAASAVLAAGGPPGEGPTVNMQAGGGGGGVAAADPVQARGQQEGQQQQAQAQQDGQEQQAQPMVLPAGQVLGIALAPGEVLGLPVVVAMGVPVTGYAPVPRVVPQQGGQQVQQHVQQPVPQQPVPQQPVPQHPVPHHQEEPGLTPDQAWADTLWV